MFVVHDERSDSNLVGCIGRDSGWDICNPGHQHRVSGFSMMVMEALLQKRYVSVSKKDLLHHLRTSISLF